MRAYPGIFECTFTLLVLFSAAGVNGQYVADSIYGLARVDDEYPSWSPTGDKLVFQSNRNGPYYNLYTMNADGSNLQRITNGDWNDETPVWSADGRQILFSRYLDTVYVNNELFLLDLQSGESEQITNHPLRDGHAKFSTDGSRIIFNAMRDETLTPEAEYDMFAMNYELYEMDRGTGSVVRRTEYHEWDTYPSFSPDGRRVLWRRILADSTAPRGYNSEIFLMNTDGSGLMNLSKHPAFDGYPEWSPDGRWIVFASSRHGLANGHLQLFVMKNDGSAIRQISWNVLGEEDVRPDWSPDGRRIVFNRVNENGSGIHIMEVSEDFPVTFFNEFKSAIPGGSKNSSRGVAWGDTNGDGFPEVLISNTMNASNDVFINNGQGGFARETEGPAATSGGWTEGVSLADVDNDGDLDVLYVNQFNHPAQLLKNDGSGNFELSDSGELGSQALNAPAACWCDYDLDGDLDVYVVQRDGADDFLFNNSGDGRFLKVKPSVLTPMGGDGRACAWGDTNSDGYPDLYVGNFLDTDGPESARGRNFYYLNNGNGSFSLREDTVITSDASLTYGVSFVDFDQDNDLDLFLTNIGRSARNQLYSNDGAGNFTVTHTLIGEKTGSPSKGHTWGDFDNDGNLDLFIANGTEGVSEEETFNQLFLNQGDGTFARVRHGAVVTTPTISAGVAGADFDRDGDLDIMVANWGANAEENRFYRNDVYGTHWMEIRLKGTSSNSYGIGSKVRVRCMKDGAAVWLTRWLLPQTGYASQNEPILHFGLGHATYAEAIEVTWPSGEIQRLGNTNADQLITITEP